MAIGDTIKRFFRLGGYQLVMPGSVQSEWQTANTDVTTVNSAGELLYPASVNDATVTPVDVPPGVVRALVRLRYPVATTTFTTQPRLRLYGVDANGVPMRLDSLDANGTGFVYTASASVAKDATYYYSNPFSLTAFDLFGMSTLYVLVETASAFTDGATPQVVAAQILLLN